MTFFILARSPQKKQITIYNCFKQVVCRNSCYDCSIRHVLCDVFCCIIFVMRYEMFCPSALLQLLPMTMATEVGGRNDGGENQLTVMADKRRKVGMASWMRDGPAHTHK